MKKVQKISCVNSAAFVMNFSVCYIDENGETIVSRWNSGNYPVGQERICNLAVDVPDIPEGAIVWPRVNAVLGKSQDGTLKLIYDGKCQLTAVYRVTGTTLNYNVKIIG
ncbi:MAG: FAD-linked oxidoreductase [Firmicutes bacterium]|nr:FAD-linked oxidoreductase [Bacillota bacterium]